MADPLAPHSLPQIDVEAAAVADALGLSLIDFRQRMDSGRIRTLSERGTGADLGRYRLTFWHGERRYRIITDASGGLLASDLATKRSTPDSSRQRTGQPVDRPYLPPAPHPVDE